MRDDFSRMRAALGANWPAACRVFIDHSQRLLGDMAAAEQAGDAGALEQLAYAMRGGCEMMGAVTCAAIARDIEHSAGGPPARTVTELARAFERVAAALTDEFAHEGGAAG